MRRLGLAVGLVLSLLVPMASEAQQPGRIPRIGVLTPGNPPPRDPFHQRESFEDGLCELGWMPGTTVLIEYRHAEGDRERLLKQAGELTQLPVDVIVARSGIAIRAARDTTLTIPIVMSVRTTSASWLSRRRACRSQKPVGTKPAKLLDLPAPPASTTTRILPMQLGEVRL